jgi:hypothetical protein
MRSMLNGVNSAGLTTTVQPQASAGAICHIPIIIGKFHGMMAHVLSADTRERFTGVTTLNLDQFLGVLLEQVRRTLEDSPPVRGTHSAPDFQSSPSGLHRYIHIRLTSQCNRSKGHLVAGSMSSEYSPRGGEPLWLRL